MITWLAIKAAMSSALAWCKERWELLVGVLVGILGMIALRGGKSNDTSQHLEEELKARKEFQEKTAKIKEKEVEEILKANEDFLRSAAKTEKEFQDVMDSLSKEKKEKIIESQKSGQSAEELAKLLGLKIK